MYSTGRAQVIMLRRVTKSLSLCHQGSVFEGSDLKEGLILKEVHLNAAVPSGILLFHCFWKLQPAFACHPCAASGLRA